MGFSCMYFLLMEGKILNVCDSGNAQHVASKVNEEEEERFVCGRIMGQICKAIQQLLISVVEKESHHLTIEALLETALFRPTIRSSLIIGRSKCSPKSKWEVQKGFLKEFASEGICC